VDPDPPPPPPRSPKYDCNTTAYAGQSLGNAQGNITSPTPGYGQKLGVDISLTFNATGPGGILLWDDAQYRTGYGWANYSDGTRIQFVSDNQYEHLNGQSAVSGSWTEKDQPGFPWKGGTIVDAYWQETYVLNTWYNVNGTTVKCPTVTWKAEFSRDKDGKISGGAYVVSVSQ
jgi:hypothetical protein